MLARQPEGQCDLGIVGGAASATVGEPMQLTALSRYAVPALAYLAAAGRRAGCEEIAGAFGLPADYLARALILLRQAGIVDGFKGPRGGYRLARPARRSPCLTWWRRPTAR